MFRFSRAAAHMSLAASLFCLAGAASAAFISLDPRATYLRVNEYKHPNQFSAGGLPLDATAYSLAALGFAPG